MHAAEVLAAVKTSIARAEQHDLASGGAERPPEHGLRILEDADDAEYKKFATMLLTGGKELAAACKEKNFDAASKATNLIVNSCEKCHEAYR